MRKILALFPGALGDFVCFLPALEILARRGGVDLFARSAYADLAPPAVDIGSIERWEISRLFVSGAGDRTMLGRFFDRYESIYSWTGSSDDCFVRNLEILAGGRAKLFSFRPPDPAVHISDYYLSCVAGTRSDGMFPRVRLRSEALLWSRRWLGEGGFGGKRILALAPGSGAREKNWPLEFFRGVQKWWEETAGGRNLVILGPAEEEEEGMGNRCDWGGAIIARNLDLARVAALLSSCDLYLGNDSGITHLAASAGVATVALFGPTAPWQWAPRGPEVTVVSQNVECSPCVRGIMKTCPHRKCLTALRPEFVVGLLQNRSRANGSISRQAP